MTDKASTDATWNEMRRIWLNGWSLPPVPEAGPSPLRFRHARARRAASVGAGSIPSASES